MYKAHANVIMLRFSTTYTPNLRTANSPTTPRLLQGVVAQTNSKNKDAGAKSTNSPRFERDLVDFARAVAGRGEVSGGEDVQR